MFKAKVAQTAQGRGMGLRPWHGPTAEERTRRRLTDDKRLKAVREQLAGSEAQAQPVLASRLSQLAERLNELLP